MAEYDAVVVGAGPNGLAAAAELSRRGRRVLVVEQADEIGGGTRTEELTLPGFAHDVCSAIHPLGVGSPFFRDLGLEVDWVHPDIPLAHPLGGGRVGVVERDVEATAARFGDDARHYRRILGPLVQAADAVMEDILGPMTLVPDNPGSFVKLGNGETAVVVRSGEAANTPHVCSLVSSDGRVYVHPIPRDTARPEFKVAATVARSNVLVRLDRPGLYGLGR